MAGKTESIRIRIEPEIRDKAEHWAQTEGVKISVIVRNALETYLQDDHAHLRRVAGKSASPKPPTMTPGIGNVARSPATRLKVEF